MHHIIYLSRAAHALDETQLQALLLQARTDNARQHVTGALLYGDGQFLQVIEGEAATLNALYARLLQDPRHTQLVKFADKAITARSFADWAMAYQPASAAQLAELRQLAGFQELAVLELTPPSLSEIDAGLLRLLYSLVFPAPK